MIYNNHRELWKVSTETLYQQAMENTQRDYPATIKSIIQIISGYEDCVDTKSGEYGDMPPFYVLSNSSALNGTGTILYKNVLSDFSAEKQCDLYILPSSLYEVLLFPSDGKIDARKLKRTVEEAAAYSGIGINKLRNMSEDDRCGFVLWNGSKRLIKRRKLDEYTDKVYSI